MTWRIRWQVRLRQVRKRRGWESLLGVAFFGGGEKDTKQKDSFLGGSPILAPSQLENWPHDEGYLYR